MTDNDAAMRQHAASTPMPEFDEPAFTLAKPLAKAKVAIVTSAALHVDGDTGWAPNADPQFKRIDEKTTVARPAASKTWASVHTVRGQRGQTGVRSTTSTPSSNISLAALGPVSRRIPETVSS